MKEKIFRAGLIPYIVDDEVEMLFMRPSDSKYGGNQFQIAKGKREDGESDRIAAIREGREELGFTMLNAATDVKELGNFLGRTKIYVVKVKDKNMFLDTDSETGETKWLSLEGFIQEGRDLHKHVVKAAGRLILKMEKDLKD